MIEIVETEIEIETAAVKVDGVVAVVDTKSYLLNMIKQKNKIEGAP